MSSSDELRLRIQQELVASGKYQEIYNLLKVELVNSGWFSQFQDVATETISKRGDQAQLRFNDVVGELEGKGFEMVPDTVKVKVLKKIKEFLDGVVE